MCSLQLWILALYVLTRKVEKFSSLWPVFSSLWSLLRLSVQHCLQGAPPEVSLWYLSQSRKWLRDVESLPFLPNLSYLALAAPGTAPRISPGVSKCVT